MKTIAVYALIALNLALGMTLLARYGKEQTAVAQVGRPSDYQLIPASVNGQADAVIYILDQTHGLLGAMTFNSATGQFDVMQPIEVGRLIDARTGANPNTPPAPRGNTPRR